MHAGDDTVGIDGCRGGWIVASLAGAVVVPRLDIERFGCAGVDMPIGLSDGTPRQCDIDARRFLGRARSSVFPAPPRAALRCATYSEALEVARRATGRGISVQTYNIIAKVAELDAVIDPDQADVVVEVHPECSFTMLNHGESLPSKKSADGRELRRRLLEPLFDVPLHAPAGAAIDDLLDAYAVLWSTLRFRRGEHRVFGDGRRDDRGIEMRIVC
jgi:predicted RNase H-like nuclease